MNKQSNQELQDSISQISYQIKQLRKNADKCEVTNRLYNRLIVERAAKKQELEKKKNRNLLNLIKETFLRKKSKQKLICDYFN